ncbi:MAG: hypothetical protein QXT25_03390, partial [Candidatus Anstonellaceae archaeon]
MAQQTVIEELIVAIKADMEKAEADLKKLKAELKKVDETAAQTAKGGWAGFVDQLKEAANPLLKQNALFKQATELINDTGKSAANLFRVLLSNPFGLLVTAVGALVGALAGLVKIFMATEEGGDRVRRVIAGLKEIWETFIGVLQETALGAASVLEGIFSFDFQKIRQGLDRVADGWANIGDKMGEAYERGKQIFDLQEQLIDMQIANTTELARKQAEYNALLEEAATKERGAERVALLQKAKSINDQIIDTRKKELQLQLQIMREQTKANETSKETLLEIAKLEAELISLEAQRSRQNKRIVAEIAATRRQEAEALRQLAEEQRKMREEELMQQIKQQAEAQIEAYDALRELTADITARFGDLDSELQQVDLTLEEVDEGINQLAETHTENMARMAEQAKIYQQELSMVAGLVSDTLVNAFMQAVQAGESMGQALVNAFRQILIQLTAMVAKALVFRAIVAALGGGVAGSGLLTAGQAIFGLGGMRGIGSFATGGIVRGPQLAIVGDNPAREELIIPKERYSDFFGGGN